MKGAFSRRTVVGLCLIVAVAAALMVSACAPDATAAILSPNMGPQLAAEQSGGEVVAVTPTPVPLLVNLTPDEIYAGLPDDLAEAVANANIENGPVLATSKACIGCHVVDPNVTMTGPTWHNVGDRAIARQPGVSPAEYLHQSIVNPASYLVPDYPNVMPANYSELLTTQELGDMIGYLLSLNGQP